MMQVYVNGRATQVNSGDCLSDLLAQLALDAPGLAVERNLEIVPRSFYARTVLGRDDRLEIVHFVGGG